MRLEHKIALITGAGSGIGRATALLFAEEGASVAIADIDADGGQETAKEIHQAGGQALFCRCDVSKEKEVEEMIKTVVSEYGGLDILVNNAAAFVFGTVEEATEEDWDRVLGVNVKGYAFCTKYAAPVMRERGGGAIVNLGSTSSFVAQPAFVPYNSSKGAVLQLTRCLAYDLAKDNIRVNCVCPGAIDTPATLRHAQFTGMTKEELVEEIKPMLFIKRMGDPKEIAYTVLFFASDEASFITAATLLADGGYTAH